MRIAYLINQYPKVSHSFIRREILALERQGFEVMRISIRGGDGQLLDPEDILEHAKTRYVLREGLLALIIAIFRALFSGPMQLIKALGLAWRMSRHAERPFLIHLAYLAEACRIVPWLREADIDHLHAHFGTNSAEVAMLTHILGGPAWSFTVHGPEEFDKPHFIGLAEKIRQCAFVVAISSFGRSQLFRTVGLEYWSRVVVVHCGIEARFYAGNADHSFEPRRLVCVGRLCEQKGQLLLVKAANLLTLRGIDLQLVLAGDGEMREELETLIEKYGLGSKVRITGWITGPQVRQELLSARALILPSFAEGLPVVIMEAMALRRPVISTYVAGIPELIVPRQHGWLIPAGDLDALADAILECLEVPTSEIERMGNAAHARVVDRHNADIEAAKLALLFTATVEDARRHRPLQ
jgi:glycosyltransferase involved in cell wall biosynthesis